MTQYISDAKKPSRTKAYKIPPPLPSGEVLIDVKKKPWKIGQGIGQGGFGLIYLGNPLISLCDEAS